MSFVCGSEPIALQFPKLIRPNSNNKMTPQQILAIGFRLTSIALVFAGLQYITSLPSAQGVFESAMNTPYLAVALYFSPAIFLWLFPMWAAHKILPRTAHENRINIHSIEFTRVGCCLIGLWIFSQGILNSSWHILWFFIFGGKTSFVSSLAPDAQLDLLMSLVTIACGVVLMVSNNKFAKLLTRQA